MKNFLLLTTLFFISFTKTCISQIFDDTTHVSVIVIPVSGTVDPGMAAYIGRALKTNIPAESGTEQSQKNKKLFILEMDTFGGRVDAALQIVDTLSMLPKGKTVALVTKRAISAGSLIALACNTLFMKPNTTIGDCAPISFTNDGPQMLGEKFQSPLRAKFRALAKRNNYPSVLAESMVSADMMVYEIMFSDTVLYVDSLGYENFSAKEKATISSKKVVVARGELLTMDDQEAHTFGFSKQSVNTIEEILLEMNILNYTIHRIKQSWSEEFVRFIGSIAPILMMIGFAALYTELKAPGFGLPGIIGILCLTLVFGGQYMVGLADYTELIIIVTGITLLGLELFVLPGFGVIGIAGMVLIASGMVLSLQDFVIPKPELPWQKELMEKNISTMLKSLLGSVVLILLFFRYLFPKISTMISGPYLATTLADAHAGSDNGMTLSIGDRGRVTKTLRPSGNAQFKNGNYDVLTYGEFIEKNKSIKIVELNGNRVIVTRDRSNDV